MHAATTTTPLVIKGKTTHAPSLVVDDHRIVCEGSWLRTAKIFDEVWLAAPPLISPAALIERVAESDLGADLFTFSQPLPDVTPRHTYHCDFDSLAIAPTTDFKAWWEGLPHESRKNVRKAQKRGVTVGPVEFTDELVAGIKGLYDETPVRQGRRFWHYGKDLATVKRENATYLERSQFVGAMLEGKLIGFLKMVYTGSSARIMQILAMNAHFDKHITNALLASAMELCSQKPVARLIYGQYIYGNKASSSVTEFKRRNGFHEALVPRYYVPLTLKGRVAIASGTHRGLTGLVPEPLINVALKARTFALRSLPSRAPRERKARTTV
jgi:hypothetical protein